MNNNKALPNEYINKKKYTFGKLPQNLKYKLQVTNTNTERGLNDRFEIFISFKDNKEYLISPNCYNYNLDIFTLVNNKKITSLSGHKNKIITIRYFLDCFAFCRNKSNQEER